MVISFRPTIFQIDVSSNNFFIQDVLLYDFMINVRQLPEKNWVVVDKIEPETFGIGYTCCIPYRPNKPDENNFWWQRLVMHFRFQTIISYLVFLSFSNKYIIITLCYPPKIILQLYSLYKLFICHIHIALLSISRNYTILM